MEKAENEITVKKGLTEWLLSPWVVFFSVFVGVYIGIYQKELVPYVSPVGTWYLCLLKMCILPILLSAIAGSLGRLMRSDVRNRYFRRMLIGFITAMFLTSFFGAFIGLLSGPGSNLSSDVRSTLGSIIQSESDEPDLEINYSHPNENLNDEISPFQKFFNDMIPSNIFNALSFDDKLKVLFFSIITGLAIGFIKKNEAEVFFSLLDAVYQAFAKVVAWLMYLLPFGLCGLIADQLSQIGVHILLAMTKFVVIVVPSFLFVIVLSGTIVWIRSGSNLKKVFNALEEPFVISFATGNSLAAIPSTLTHMQEGLKFEKRVIDLVVPLGVTICRYGPVFYFAFACMFVIQLYQIELGLQQFLIVIAGSVLAGMATAGAAGILTLTMLALVLESIGLPLDAVLVLLIVVDPITAPLRSVTNIYVTCAATSWVVEPHRDINLYIGKNDRRVLWEGNDQRQPQQMVI